MADDDYPAHRTKQFGNGDVYTGTWSPSGLPDGEGKYTWGDGSAFEGSWKEGVRHGIGKYTWPSGATYHGEWRDGCMTGVGTWESPDGLARYQGGWLRDVKHGLGRQVYASGDVYEGLWKQGFPGGPGRYVYSDGNEYDGEWRAGKMHGQGTFVWRSGERYDGEWKEARMDGSGLFTAADGSTYDGRWRRGRKHGVGLFRPGAHCSYHMQPAPAAAVASVGSGADPSLVASRAANGTHGGGFGLEHSVATLINGNGHGMGAPRPSKPGSSGRRHSHNGGGAARGSFRVSHNGGSGFGAESTATATATATASPTTTATTAIRTPTTSPGVSGLPGASLPASPLGGGAGGVAGGLRSPALASVGSGGGGAAAQQQQQQHRAATGSALAEGLEPSLRGPIGQQQQPYTQQLQHANTALQSDTGSLSTAPSGIPPPAPPPAEDGNWAATPQTGPAHAGPAPWRPRSGSGTAAADRAGATAAATTPASKLVFVRVYDKGRLVRETALGSDEVEALLPGGLGAAAAGRGRDERGPTTTTAQLLRMLRGGARGAAAVGGRPWPRGAGGIGMTRGPRLGDPVTRAHHAYSLMVALQLGIRYSVGRISHEPLPRTTSPEEYALRVQQEFPRGGSEMTPVHPGEDFTWSDYAPITFRRLRESFGVDASTYMLSLCSDHSLRHLPSPGKSGSVFFLSQDERFFLKTMSRAEMEMLLGLLPAYHRHVERHPHTLLCRFFGLHCVTASAGRKYRFVVMSNIFRTPLQLHRKYDLKGSTLGRTAGRPPADDPTVIFKDLDLDLRFRLEEGWRDRLLFQLRADCGLLSGSGVMDYSLLVGLHFRNRPGQQPQQQGTAEAEGGEAGPQTADFSIRHNEDGDPKLQQLLAAEFSRIQDRIQRLRPRVGEEAARDLAELVAARFRAMIPASRGRGGRDGTPGPSSPPNSLPAGVGTGSGRSAGRAASQGRGQGPGDSSVADAAAGEAVSVNDELALSCGQSRVQLGVNMAATAVHPDGREEQVVLWFALIDILQPYNTTKRLEHSLKSVIHSSRSISVTHPTTYANRFQTFMKRVFE